MEEDVIDCPICQQPTSVWFEPGDFESLPFRHAVITCDCKNCDEEFDIRIDATISYEVRVASEED